MYNFVPVNNFVTCAVNTCCGNKREESCIAGETAVSVNKVSVAAVVEAALDSLEKFSVPEFVTSDSSLSCSLVYQDAADLPSLSSCTTSHSVFNPASFTADFSLSASVSQESSVASASVFSASLTGAVNLTHSAHGDSCLVSTQQYESMNHCDISATRVRSLSTRKTSSSPEKSKLLSRWRNAVSVNLCRRLPTNRSCSSSGTIISHAHCSSVAKATALKNELPIASESGCDGKMLSHDSVLAGNSLMQVPHNTAKTLESSYAVTKMSSVVSSEFHTIISTRGTVSSVSECTSTVTSSQNWPVLLPSLVVPVNELRPQTASVASISSPGPSLLVCTVDGSTNQLAVQFTSQHLDRNLRSRSALLSGFGKSSGSNVMPLSEAVSLPCSSFSSTAANVSVVSSCKPTRISSQTYFSTASTACISNSVYSCATNCTGIVSLVRGCTVPAVGMFDQVRMCTVPVTSTSNKDHAAIADSAASDGVQVYAVPAGECFSDARICTVPTFRVSSPVQPQSITTDGFSRLDHVSKSMPVCRHTMPASGISSCVAFDRIVPTVGISSQTCTCTPTSARIYNKVYLSAVPSCGICCPVFQRNVPMTTMLESGNSVSDRDPVTSSRVQSSASVPRTQHVLPPVTGCSDRQTPNLLAASVPNSLSKYPSALPTFRVAVKPLKLFPSTRSLARSQHISDTSSMSVSDRHYLDSLVSQPVVSSVTRCRHIHVSSLHGSTAAGSYVDRTSVHRNPLVTSSDMKLPVTSVVSSISVFPGVLDPPAGSISSFAALTSCSENITHSAMLLRTPQHQPLLEKLALQLSVQKLPTAVTRLPVKVRHINSFLGAADLVSSPENVLHQDNTQSHCRSSNAVSFSVPDKDQESVVKITSSSAVCYPQFINSTISSQNIGTSSSATAIIASDKAVVMVTAVNYSNVENHRLTTSMVSSKAAEPGVMATASLEDYRARTSRVKSCLADNTADSDTRKSLDVRESTVDNSHPGSGETSGNVEMVSAVGVWRKSRRVKLCREVSTAILCIITIYL